jgi:hypothetical protein
MATATIVNHPALTARRPQPAAGNTTARRTAVLALAAPVLAIALSWGLVDACAYTQHSLMGLYAASASASV